MNQADGASNITQPDIASLLQQLAAHLVSTPEPARWLRDTVWALERRSHLDDSADIGGMLNLLADTDSLQTDTYYTLRFMEHACRLVPSGGLTPEIRDGLLRLYAAAADTEFVGAMLTVLALIDEILNREACPPVASVEPDMDGMTATEELDEQARSLLVRLFEIYRKWSGVHHDRYLEDLAAVQLDVRDASPEAKVALFHAATVAFLDALEERELLTWQTREWRQGRLGEMLHRLAMTELPFRTGDLCRTADMLADRRPSWHPWARPALQFCFKVIHQFTGRHGLPPALRDSVIRLREASVRENFGGYHASAILPQLDRLLGIGQRPANMVEPGDGWGNAALASLDRMEPEERATWMELVRLASSADAVKPSTRWLAKAHTRVTAMGEEVFRRHALEWLGLFTGTSAAALSEANGGLTPYPALSYRNTCILKGLVWCCTFFEDRDLATAAGKTALEALGSANWYRERSIKLGNATIWALGEMPGIHSVVQLQRLGQRIKNHGARRRIEQALAAAAERAGLTRDDLDELVVPEYGLMNGRVQTEMSEYRAEIVVTGPTRVETRWFKPDGSPLKAVPAAVKREHKDELKALKQTAEDIGTALLVHRDRLDRLMLSTRLWSLQELRERYLEHPLLSLIARRLIWSFGEDGEGQAGAWLDRRFVDVEDQPLEGLTDETRVRLWHPITTTPDGVLAWREWLERHGIQQPFKQAHREVYILTAAEERTATYSNRFAAHIIRQHQFNSLCIARGWRNKLRLMVDDSYPPASRDLPEWGLRAEFWVEGAGDEYGVDTNDTGTFNWLATDQVRFYRIGDAQRHAHASGGGYRPRGWRGDDDAEPVPLDQIPPLAFSEIMRDVDLFVGVASVANDPEWQDGGPNGRYQDYWRSHSFGDLSATAQTRKAVLERLVPRLKIAERCRLTDKFLVVRGEIRTYKIHLGSGNILMEPNDQYLCIVPGRGTHDTAAPGTPQLPFEGDRVLSIILSKAFLLADDRNITDPTITRQLT